MHIYIASSWRNTYYPEVVQALRDAGTGTSRASAGIDTLVTVDDKSSLSIY